MSVRAVLSSLALAGATAVVPVAASAPAVAGTWYVDTGKACNYHTYRDHYTVAVSANRPVLTHVQTFGMPPSASHTVTKTVAHATTLAARVAYNAEFSLSSGGASKILGQASAKVGYSLAARGSHTTRTSTKVTDTIRNSTRRNAAFVFYAGDTQAKGSYRYWFCEQSHSYSPWTVRYAPGHWSSYGVHGDGAARCGIAGVTRLQKLALKVGCQ